LKRFIILGSTGSIGSSSLDVIDANPAHFTVVGLGAGSSVEKIYSQIVRFRPQAVAMGNPDAACELRARVGPTTKVYEGVEGINAMIRDLDADGVINGLVGSVGLLPTITALENGKDVLIANKETLVMGGSIVMDTARHHGRRIVPIDSEMSAIYQCLKGEAARVVSRLVLTASGGPFVDVPLAELNRATFTQALNHPTWIMGTKNTIDSATMMNKGLEVIEASFLFGIPGERIDVTIHRNSLAHSFVEFIDGSFLCQVSRPDMRLAIQYAMTDPERLPSPYGGLDFTMPFYLTFEPPDTRRFPCLRLAYEALARGGTAPAAMNGANEQAVKAFEAGYISFMDIPALIETVVHNHTFIPEPAIKDLLETDERSKRAIQEMISQKSDKTL